MVDTAAAATSSRADGFRPDVEGLRGIAVLLVILFHADLLGVAGGFVGVDVFFVISGFLITGLLLRERERTGRIGLVNFYARRVRRLMPAAVVTLAVVLPIATAILAPLDRPAVAVDGAASALTVANFRFALAEGDYFTSMANPSPFLHFWSLSVEEQFYFVWPALLLLGARGRRPRIGAGAALLVVLVASLAASIIVTDLAPSWAFYSLPTRAWQLATGGLLAVAAIALARIPDLPMAALGWLGMAGVLAAPFLVDTTVPYPGVAALLPTAGAAALIAAGERRGSPARLLAVPPLRFLGRISYSLYLWHWPILVLPAIAAGAPLEPAARVLLVALAVVVATLSWRFVEEPFRRGFPSLARRPYRTLTFAAGALAFVVGLAGGISTRQAHDLDLLSASSTDTAQVGNLPDDGSGAGDGQTGDGLEPSADDGSSSGLPDDTTGDSWLDDDPDFPAGGGLPASPSPSPTAVTPGATATPRPTPAPPVSYVLPRNVRPSVARARDDEERLRRDGCLAFEGVTAPRDCAYGDPRGTFTVALVGDSHASAWFPALEAVAKKHGWRLETYVKVACPFIDMRVRNLTLKREYFECAAFRESVISHLRATRPDLVVVSNSRWMYPLDPGDATASREGAAFARMLARIPGRVAVLADTPAADREIPSCLSANVADIRRCAIPRSVAFSGGMLTRERIASDATGIPVVNLTRAICPADPCPAVVRGMIVLRDKHHLTATFSRSLAPYLDKALATILEPAASPSPTPAPGGASAPSGQPAPTPNPTSRRDQRFRPR